MLPTQIDRREALAGIAAIFGTALIPPLRRAVAAEADPGMGPQTVLFSDAQRALLDALCERIIPTTDTPGAMAAGVTRYIEMILDAFYEASERTAFINDIRAVDHAARERYSQSFNRLVPEQQDALIGETEQGRLEGVSEAFFATIKQLTMTGYYTSEVGMTVERQFLPVPGRYDGAYPLENVDRPFAF